MDLWGGVSWPRETALAKLDFNLSLYLMDYNHTDNFVLKFQFEEYKNIILWNIYCTESDMSKLMNACERKKNEYNYIKVSIYKDRNV